MKKFFLFTAFTVLSLYARADEHLVSFTLFKTVTVEEFQAQLKKYHIPKSFVKVRYAVDIYDIIYKTTWHDGSTITASGLYYVPKDEKAAMPQAVMHHGTRIRAGRKDKLGGEESLSLGMAVDGYLVLFPDYVGLGHGEKFHLYQNALSEGQATVDMLFAVRELNAKLGVKANDQLFITGYSQGGHAAMAAHKLIEAKYQNEFKVTASSPMSGAYDMTGVQAEVMFHPYTQSFYLPFLLRGINEVYHYVPDINSIYKSPYDTLIPKLFDGNNDIKEINESLPPIPKDMIKDSLVLLFNTDSTNIVRKALKENSLVNWIPKAPMQLCYCKSDAVVSYKNSIEAYKSMKALGATHITLRPSGRKYGHVKCAAFAAQYSKLYFDSFRKGSKYGNRGSAGKRMMLKMSMLFIKK